MQPVNLPLSAPIKANGKDLDALTLRPLTARDIRRCGYPLRFVQSGDDTVTIWDGAVFSALLAELSGVPVSSIDMMAPPDWQKGSMAVLDFLGGGAPPTSSTAPGDSPPASAT